MASPIGYSPLDWAIKLASQHPATVGDTPTPEYAHFINVCYCLQEKMGDDPIAILETLWGGKLGVSQRTISSYRRHAEEQGWLRKEQRHN
jgi:hypothetical protein